MQQKDQHKAAYLQLVLPVLQVRGLCLQSVAKILQVTLTLTYLGLSQVQSLLPLSCPF